MPEAPLTPGDIGEQELKAGYWFVTNKIKIRKVLIGLLIAVDAALVGYSGTLWVLDLVRMGDRQREFIELVQMRPNPAIRSAHTPQALIPSNTQILAPKGKYDFVALLKNPNSEYAAKFTYRFVAGAFATKAEKGFVLPGEEKYLVSLGVASESRPSGAALEVSEVAWQRIDRHQYPDWGKFAAEHLKLTVTDPVYTPAIVLEEGKGSLGKSSFSVVNDTGYGYYDVRLIVLAYRGPMLAGVNTATIAQLRPGQTQSAEVTWYEDLGAVTQTKVLVDLNILDPASYIKER